MQDLNDKVTSNTLTADEWNEMPTELQNIIVDTGQSLSGGDFDQVGKGVSAYAAVATFYTGSGTANAHILTRIGDYQAPYEYRDGMIIRFRPSTENTGASTVNVNSLGVKNVKKEDGSAISRGDLSTDRDAWLRYDGTNFLLSSWSAKGGDPKEFSGHFVRTDGDTYTLYPGIGGQIVINVDGVRLTRTAALTFDFGDIDTGAEAASTAYYFYIDNLAGVMTAVVSVTPPTPLDAIGKAGYHPGRTDERCVLGVWNDVGSNFVEAMHMPDGTVLYRNHGADHEHDLADADSTSWVNLPVNIPETAMSVLFCASARTTTGDGMVCFGHDGATGTLTVNTVDPTNGGFEDVILWGSKGGSNDGNGYSVQGEIPIVDRTTPAMSYGITDDVSDHVLIVRGYRDMFAPRL